jgi:branched-subunit amino acid transport protein
MGVGAAVTAPWVVVLVVGLVTMAIKAAGPVLLGGRELPPRALAVVRLLAPALLAALVVTQTAAGEEGVVLDARLVGVGVALVALLLRAPLLLVVFLAAVATALFRLWV